MSGKSYGEAVFLLDENRIEKQMLFSEFEAILDGVASLTEFSQKTCRAIYLQVNPSMQIVASVLFVIGLDEQGRCQPNWHLPFTQLSEKAGKGPNLGAGPIRLTCAGQCSVPWHHNKLWSVDDFPDVFILMQQALAENKLYFNFEEEPETFQLPVLDIDMYHDAQHDDRDDDLPFDVQSRIDTEKIQLDIDPDLMAKHWNKKILQLEKEYKDQQSQSNKSHQLDFSKLKDSYEKRLLYVTQEYEQSSEEVSQQLLQLNARLDVVLAQKKLLEESNQLHRQQIEDMEEKIQLISKQAEEKLQQELQAVIQKTEEANARNLGEAHDRWQKELEKKDQEIELKHELVKQLRKDICDLRRDKLRLMNTGADKFLENLENLGISFIVFHPGAGHISIPLADMTLYMENPVAYAANRCSVTEEHYREWLQHYENPVCRFQINKEEICGSRIKRIDVPKEFKMSAADRCPKHPSVSADWIHAVKPSS